MAALMNDPKMSKLVRDALNSPLGSTARQRLRKTLGTLNKLHLDPNDGKGGPGMMMLRQDQGGKKQTQKKSPEKDPAHIPTDGSKGLVYFKPIPKPKINYGPRKQNATATMWKPKAGSFDGVGGPGYDGKGGVDWGGAIKAGVSAPFELLGAGVGAVAKGAGQTVRDIATAPYYFGQGLGTGAITGYQGTTSKDIMKKPTDATTPGAIGFGQVGNIAGQALGGVARYGIPAVKTALQVPSEAFVKGLDLPAIPYTAPATSSPQSKVQTEAQKKAAATKTEPSQTETTNETPWTRSGAQKSTLGQTSGAPQVGAGSKVPDPAEAKPVPDQPILPTGAKTGAQTGVSQKKISAPEVGVTSPDQKQTGGAFNVEKFKQAISGVESGGNYGAKGPVQESGDRAYGKYQIMGSNIPSWTKEALGEALTPARFLVSPEAQEDVASYMMQKYYNQRGSAADVASMWFTGRPYEQAGGTVSDSLGTTNQTYVQKVLNNYAGLGGAMDAGGTGTSGVYSDPRFGLLSSAVAGHAGAGVFAEEAMKLPTDEVTGGQSLSDRLDAEKIALQKEYDLENLKNIADQTANASVETPKDLTDYIRQQDVNLHQLDEQKAAFVAKLQTMDLTVPGARAAADAYMKFLDSERGKISARYASYVTNASDDLTEKAKIASENYKSALEGYKTALSDKVSMTKDEYKAHADALAKMYVDADTSEKEAVQLEQAYATLNKTLLDTAKSAADSPNTYNKTRDALVRNIIDSDGLFIPGHNIYNVLSDMSNEVDPIKTINILTNQFERNMKNNETVVGADGTSRYPKVDKESTFQNVYSDYAHLWREWSEDPNIPQEYANEMAVQLGDIKKMYDSYWYNRLAGDAENVVSDYAKTVDSLYNKKWFGGPVLKTREEFVQGVQDTTYLNDYEKANVMYDILSAPVTVPDPKTGKPPYTNQQYYDMLKKGTDASTTREVALSTFAKLLSDLDAEKAGGAYFTPTSTVSQ